jgi:hypothetical protein
MVQQCRYAVGAACERRRLSLHSVSTRSIRRGTALSIGAHTLDAPAKDCTAPGRRARQRNIMLCVCLCVRAEWGKRRQVSGRRFPNRYIFFPGDTTNALTPLANHDVMPLKSRPPLKHASARIMFHTLERSRRHSHTDKRVICHCYAASRCSRCHTDAVVHSARPSALFVAFCRPQASIR